MRFTLYLLACTLFILCSCVSAPKLLEQRRYDEAYELAVRQLPHLPYYPNQLRGNIGRRKMRNYLDAYYAVQAQDYELANQLRQAPGPDKYGALYELYANLEARSRERTAITRDSNDLPGYEHLAPAPLGVLRETARLAAGQHLLSRIDTLLPTALQGYKMDARSAWELHQEVAYFLPEKDLAYTALRRQLADIGTLRIQLYAPPQAEESRLRSALNHTADFAHDWTEILTGPTRLRIDLDAELLFESYTSSRPTEDCTTRDYEEEVVDWVEKKQVREKVNDSTYVEKTIEIKHYKTVYAQVTECTQQASVTAYGYVSVYDPEARDPSWAKPLRVEQSWSNEYSQARGDRRAFPCFADSGSYCSPPSERQLLQEAIDRLPRRASSALASNYAPDYRRSRKRSLWSLFDL